ncbi:MAG: hypothetical protein AAGA10_25575 [Bacteroidota bacterium]
MKDLSSKHSPLGFLIVVCLLAMYGCPSPKTDRSASTEEKPVEQKMELKITETKTPVTIDSLHLVDTLAALSELHIFSGDSLFPLSQSLLEETAKSLEGIGYYSNKIQDCSGMFRRYLSALRAASTPDLHIPDPDLVIPEPELPDSEYKKLSFSVRSTKQFGKWYADMGQFIPVHPEDIELKAYRDMIKPGMVMFYGRSQIKKKDSYKQRDMNPINHVGVVVNVEIEAGDIVRYHLFHGLYKGNPSKITGPEGDISTMNHERDYSNRTGKSRNYPSLGFADQHWIGIAPITKNLGRYKIERDTVEVPVTVMK